MKVVDIGSVPADAVVGALLEPEALRRLAGWHSAVCFALPGVRHGRAFYKRLSRHAAAIDATTRDHVLFVLFHASNGDVRLVRQHAPDGPTAGWLYDGVRLVGLATSASGDAPQGTCIDVSFSDELEALFRRAPRRVDRATFEHAMTAGTRALMDRYELSHQVEPCLLFVDPRSPDVYRVVPLDPEDPVRSLDADVLEPLSDAFRQLSAVWRLRDEVAFARRMSPDVTDHGGAAAVDADAERLALSTARLRAAGFPDAVVDADEPQAFAVVETLLGAGRIGARGRAGGAPGTAGAAAAPTVRVLVLASNAIADDRLDLGDEQRAIEEALRGAAHRDRIVLRSYHAARCADLVRLLGEVRPTILHFCGHGASPGLWLRSDAPGEDGQVPITPAGLATLCHDAGVRLAVLNACGTAPVARALHDRGTAAVGTRGEVSDALAIEFAVAFYGALGDGHPFGEALRRARGVAGLRGAPELYVAHGDPGALLTA